MTQLADIIVKNGAATPVNVTFFAQQPQSGSDAAIWYYKPVGSSRMQYWRLSATSRRSGSGLAAKSIVTLTVPFYDALGAKSFQIPIRLEVTLPDLVSDAQAKDVVMTAINLFASSLLADSIINSSPVI